MADPVEALESPVAGADTFGKDPSGDPGRMDKVMQELQASGERIKGLREQQEQAVAPLREQAIDAARQPLIQAPKVGAGLQRMPQAPNRQQMQAEMSDNMNGLLMAFTGIALLGSRHASVGATAGLSALAGAMTGLQQGQADVAKAKYEEFRAASDRVIESNKNAMTEYKAALENQRLDFDQKVEAMKLVSSKYQDQIAAELLNRKDLVTLENLFQKRDHDEKMLEMQKARLDAQIQKISGAQGASPSQASIDRLANQFLATGGDQRIITSLGNRTPAEKEFRAKLIDRITELSEAQGITPQELNLRKAELAALNKQEQVVATRSGQFGLAEAAAESLVPQARAAIEQVLRSQFIPANRAYVAVMQGTGSIEEAKLGAALNGLVNVYARALTPTGVPTNQFREHMWDVLNATKTKEQMFAVLDQWQIEMEAEKKAPQMMRERMRSQYGGAPKQQAVDTQSELAAARQAIQNGAPRDAVIRRMQERGIDPALLGEQ
jgi:hypothetical protein